LVEVAKSSELLQILLQITNRFVHVASRLQQKFLAVFDATPTDL